MPLKLVFWSNCVGFGKENGSNLVPKSDQKLISILKGRFCKNCWKALEKSKIFAGFGDEVGRQIDRKSMKSWSPRPNASWYPFFIDFGPLWEASWEEKSSQHRKKSIRKGMEKTMEKRKATRQPKRQYKTLRRLAKHLGFHFWIDFWLIFVPNIHPLDLKNHGFSFGK